MEKKNEKEVIIKISGKEWEKYLDDAFKKANKNAKIAGFRPGKAPKDIFIKHYGMESLLYEASNKAIEAAYDKMIEENKDLEIVAQPMVDITKVDEKEIEYKFVLTLKPEVKLGKYTGLKAKKENVKVTKDEVDASVKEMQNRYKENVVKEGKIASGDIAVIDFEGFKDGKPFDGGKGENYSLEIGSNTFIPGFEDQLIGHKADDEVEVKVTFPEDYHSEDLKGKAAVFKCKLNSIKENQLPELDDDYVSDVSDVETVDEYKASIRKQLEERKEKQAKNQKENKAIEKLIEDSKMDIPDSMIENQQHQMLDEFKQQLAMQGMNFDMYSQYTGMNEEVMLEQVKPEAEKRVKSRLVLEAVAKAENIEATDEDLDKKLEEMASMYKMEADKLKELVGDKEKDAIKKDIAVEKAADFIVENIKEV